MDATRMHFHEAYNSCSFYSAKRRLEGQQFTKLGQKYQHMIEMYLQSINSENTCLKVPLQVNFFKLTTFRFGFYIVNQSMVCGKVVKNRRCHVPLMAWISKRSEAIESFDNDVFFRYRSEANSFDSLNIYFEAQRTCLY